MSEITTSPATEETVAPAVTTEETAAPVNETEQAGCCSNEVSQTDRDSYLEQERQWKKQHLRQSALEYAVRTNEQMKSTNDELIARAQKYYDFMIAE